MEKLKEIWDDIPYKAITLPLAAVVLILVMWTFGAMLKEKYDKAVYDKARTEIQQEVQDAERRTNEAKGEADARARDARNTENELNEAKTKLESAERAYASAKQRAEQAGKAVPRVPVAPGSPRADDSDDALCKRANALGIACP